MRKFVVGFVCAAMALALWDGSHTSASRAETRDSHALVRLAQLSTEKGGVTVAPSENGGAAASGGGPVGNPPVEAGGPAPTPLPVPQEPAANASPSPEGKKARHRHHHAQAAPSGEASPSSAN